MLKCVGMLTNGISLQKITLFNVSFKKKEVILQPRNQLDTFLFHWFRIDFLSLIY